MNLYAEQLQRLAAMAAALNALDKDLEFANVALMFKNGVPVIDEHGDVYGYFGDEIGGAWSFWPGKENPYDKGVEP